MEMMMADKVKTYYTQTLVRSSKTYMHVFHKPSAKKMLQEVQLLKKLKVSETKHNFDK